MKKIIAHFQAKAIQNKLQKIRIVGLKSKDQTTLSQIYSFILQDEDYHNKFSSYISVMQSVRHSPESLLKSLIFIHVYIQKTLPIQEQQALLDFFSKMREFTENLIKEYEEYSSNPKNLQRSFEFAQKKRTHPITNKISYSCNNSPVSSFRSQQNFTSKQIYLLKQIIKPYLAYLMKLVNILRCLIQFSKVNRATLPHESWIMLNNLRLVATVSNNFTMIGRYYMKYYGHLIILLTEVLARDVYKTMNSLKLFVHCWNNRLAAMDFDTKRQDSADLIRLLNQISLVNEDLYSLFLGKYFSKHLKNAPEPGWIISDSNQFDHLYIKQQPRNKGKNKFYSQSKSSSLRG